MMQKDASTTQRTLTEILVYVNSTQGGRGIRLIDSTPIRNVTCHNFVGRYNSP